MRRLALLMFAGLALVSAVEAQQAHKRPGSPELEALVRTRAKQPSGTSLGSGTVQYDPGAPADALLTDPALAYFGNRFNTRNGSPLSPGTITRVSWYQGLQGNTSSRLGFIFYAPYGAPATDILVFSSPVSFAFNSGSVSPADPRPRLVCSRDARRGPERDRLRG